MYMKNKVNVKKYELFILATLMLCISASCGSYPKNADNKIVIEETKQDTLQRPMISLENEIFNLSQKYNRASDLTEILELIGKIDWLKYEKISSGKSMDLLDLLENNINFVTNEHMPAVLCANKGLDGAYSEKYSIIVGKLFLRDKHIFIKSLSQNDIQTYEKIANYIAYYCDYFNIKDIYLDTQNLNVEQDMTEKEMRAYNNILDALQKKSNK